MSADWLTYAFTPPPTATDAADSAASMLTQEPGELQNSRARLNAVSGIVTVARNPVCAAAADVAALRSALDALMVAGGRMYCVHPYLHPVGDRRGDYAYLTPEDAVGRLAQLLMDPEAPLPSGTLGAAVVLIYAQDHLSFSGQLNTFNAVFPVSELQLSQRRAEWLATLEGNKLICPPGRIWPEKTSLEPRRHGTVRKMDMTLGKLLAVVEGYAAEAADPEAELQALIAQKEAHRAEELQAWEDFSQELQGGAGQAVYVSGSARAIKAELLKSAVPDAVYKLCAAVCWVGDPDNLQVFREVMCI